MKGYNLLILLIVLIVILFIMNYKIDYKNKMEITLNSGYGVTLSYLPDFYSKCDYLNYYEIVDVLSPINDNKPIYYGNKLSLKINQLGVSTKDQYKNFYDILKYATNRNVFVWISATTKENREKELQFYNSARARGYNSIGITLATYNSDISNIVDNILNKNGHIRLVKGYYYGDLSNNWEKVGQLYEENAIKLLKSGKYHCIATQDFTILSNLNDKFSNTNNWSLVEFAFFYTAKKYVEYKIKELNLILPYKSMYIPYGAVYPYLEDNIFLLDIPKIIPRKINQIKYDYFV